MTAVLTIMLQPDSTKVSESSYAWGYCRCSREKYAEYAKLLPITLK